MRPPDATWQHLISTVHASGRKAALAITGGGSGAIGELLRVPGGSRLLIEAQVPYDALALSTFLGFEPAQACSAETAIALARTVRARASRLVPADTVLDQAAAPGVRNLGHERRQAAADGSDGETSADAVRLEIPG